MEKEEERERKGRKESEGTVREWLTLAMNCGRMGPGTVFDCYFNVRCDLCVHNVRRESSCSDIRRDTPEV